MIREPQAAQLPGDLPDAVDAVDDFLADVAALVVHNGAALDAALERDVVLIHVFAIARDAGLDARGLKGRPAGGTATGFFGRGDQFIRDGAEGFVWHVEVEARRAEARMIRKVDLAERGVGNFRGGQRQFRYRGGKAERADDLRRLGA